MPEEAISNEVVGKLIERGRGVSVATAKRFEERCHRQHRPCIVDGGVAQIGCNRVSSVRGLKAQKILSDIVEGFLPADFLPVAAAFADGATQSIRVCMKVCERLAFDAKITAT